MLWTRVRGITTPSAIGSSVHNIDLRDGRDLSLNADIVLRWPNAPYAALGVGIAPGVGFEPPVPDGVRHFGQLLITAGLLESRI
jgi:hypothetical protein